MPTIYSSPSSSFVTGRASLVRISGEFGPRFSVRSEENEENITASFRGVPKVFQLLEGSGVWRVGELLFPMLLMLDLARGMQINRLVVNDADQRKNKGVE